MVASAARSPPPHAELLRDLILYTYRTAFERAGRASRREDVQAV